MSANPQNNAENVKSGLSGYITLAIGLILGASILGFSMIRSVDLFSSSRNSISVKGVAETSAVADRAIWRGAISARNTSYREALLQLDNDRKRVAAFLSAAGFDSTEVHFLAPNAYPQYKTLPNGMQTATVDYFVAEQTVEVTTARVYDVETLVTSTEPLIRDGVSFIGYQPDFFISGIEELKVELLGAAAANAKLRAQKMIAEDGAKVGKLMSSHQGVFQIMAPNSTDDDGYGSYDTRTIQKRVRIVVTNEYGIVY